MFGVSKPGCSTRTILDLSDEATSNHSINNVINRLKLCTLEHAKTKHVVETIHALGKHAWPWANDLKDG